MWAVATFYLQSCIKNTEQSKAQGHELNANRNRMAGYWESHAKWNRRVLNPVPNPVTPVRVVPDPFGKNHIVSVSLPQKLESEEAPSSTEGLNHKDVILFFPKERSSNGAALQVKSPEGDRVLFGNLPDESSETYNSPENLLSEQTRNINAVLTPDVLAALIVASQAMRDEDFSSSVSQIISLTSRNNRFEKLGDYMVNLEYLGVNHAGTPCKVTLEVDSTGSVVGLAVIGHGQSKSRKIGMLLGLLPIPLFINEEKTCSIATNNSYTWDGYYNHKGVIDDKFSFDQTSGDILFSRKTEWQNSDKHFLSSCQRLTTSIATCGDKLTAKSEKYFKGQKPHATRIDLDTETIECKDIRFSKVSAGKFVSPEVKNKILKKGFFGLR
jgi:hypothetical protein